jgi:hypothetical protein
MFDTKLLTGTRLSKALSIGLITCCALMASPVLAELPIDGPSPLLPPDSLPELRLPLPKMIPPPPEDRSLVAVFAAHAPDAIGSAEMDGNGIIHLHIRPPREPTHEWTLHSVAPLPAPQERIGHGEMDIDRSDPHYDELLRHLGGLKPGEAKLIMTWQAGEQWHCALDPYRGLCPLQHLLPGTIERL